MHRAPLWFLWFVLVPVLWLGGMAVAGFMALAVLFALGIGIYALLLMNARIDEGERARMTS